MKRFVIIIIILAFVAALAGCEVFEEKFEVTKEEYKFIKSLSEDDIEFIKNLSEKDLEFFKNLSKADYEFLLNLTEEEYEKIYSYSNLHNLDLLLKAIKYLDDNYYEDIDYYKADIASAMAFVASQDRYSSLQHYSALASQSTAGIGLSLEVTMYNEYRITFVHPDTPAAAASEGGSYHIQRGDFIYAINGQRIDNASFAYFSALSVGGAGTTLKLSIRRGNAVLDEDFVCVKQDLVLKEAYYINNIEGVSAKAGYIKLISFTGSAVNDFTECITAFLQDNNEYLILDLRGNSGGSSNIMSSIASYLITDEGKSSQLPIIELKEKSGKTTEFTTNANVFIDKPIVVLTNSRTASAAEAMTSAMMYYGTATVIGEKTYGKGTALNSPSALTDDDRTAYFISIVVGKYYVYTDDAELDILDGVTDGKWCIDEIGLTPDIEINDREFRENMSEDPDIAAAIEHWNLA